MKKECFQIGGVFEEMFSLLPGMKKENQPSAEEYLNEVWKSVSELVMSLEDKDITSEEMDNNRFSLYISAEESRLRSALEEIKYDIDDLSTIESVTGPGRIEKVFQSDIPTMHYNIPDTPHFALR